MRRIEVDADEMPRLVAQRDLNKLFESLTSPEEPSVFARERQEKSWSGTLSTFLETTVRAAPGACTRTSHQYIWDMLRAQGQEDKNGILRGGYTGWGRQSAAEIHNELKRHLAP